MTDQLGFDLPGIPALDRADFLVAPSNAVAMAMIDAWPDWQSGKLVLCGPEGAGKTHLAHVWAARSGAKLVAAENLPQPGPELVSLAESRSGVVVEDVPNIARDARAQDALFHLHNMVLAAGGSLLLTGRAAPQTWGLSLPDLVSRLRGAGMAQLDPPDDSLLAAVLAKQFADRQAMPRPDVIPYLVAHMDRSFAEAQRIVAALDQMSLARRRPISRPMAVALIQGPD